MAAAFLMLIPTLIAGLGAGRKRLVGQVSQLPVTTDELPGPTAIGNS